MTEDLLDETIDVFETLAVMGVIFGLGWVGAKFLIGMMGKTGGAPQNPGGGSNPLQGIYDYLNPQSKFITPKGPLFGFPPDPPPYPGLPTNPTAWGTYQSTNGSWYQWTPKGWIVYVS